MPQEKKFRIKRNKINDTTFKGSTSNEEAKSFIGIYTNKVNGNANDKLSNQTSLIIEESNQDQYKHESKHNNSVQRINEELDTIIENQSNDNDRVLTEERKALNCIAEQTSLAVKKGTENDKTPIKDSIKNKMLMKLNNNHYPEEAHIQSNEKSKL